MIGDPYDRDDYKSDSWLDDLEDRAAEAREVHWVGDAPTSLHGNGAASFDRSSRNTADVTCPLCRELLARTEAREAGR